jgi:ABC-type transport system involved in multi-copper enzyme maturation permease subunit
MLNPVFRKDMLILFRNSKIYIGLAIYLLILLGITRAILGTIAFNSFNGFNPEYVMISYLVLLGFQMLAVTFIVPAFTASSISGERERQTLDFMLITRMSGFDIVVGKLMSSLLLVAIMIVAAMPIYAIIFYYGGVSVIGFLLNTVFLLIYAAFVGSIAVFFSTVLKKTAAATAVTNLAVLFIAIGLPSIIGFVVLLFYRSITSDVVKTLGGIICSLVLLLNPAVCFASIIDSQVGTDMVWRMFGEMLDMDLSIPFLQVWHIISVIYIVLTVLLLRLAGKIISPVKKKKVKKTS